MLCHGIIIVSRNIPILQRMPYEDDRTYPVRFGLLEVVESLDTADASRRMLNADRCRYELSLFKPTEGEDGA